MSRGCRPTQATGKLETASRSLSAVRSRRISPLASVSIQLAIVLIEPIVPEIGLLPGAHLQLARIHRPLHVDACFREPLQVFFELIGVHDVERSLSAVETLFDERAKHPVLFVDAIEEGADVTLSTQNAPRKLHGMLVRFHRSPRKRGMILLSSEPGAVCLLNSGSISSRDDVKRHRHSVLDLDEPARSGRRLDSEVGLLQDELPGSRQRVVTQLDLDRYDDRLHGAMKQQIACHVELVRARVELLDRDLLRTE